MYDSHPQGAWRWALDIRGVPAAAQISSLGSHVQLDEHEHRNPYLSVYLTGAYRERSATQDAVVDRPAMALHPGGVVHADRTGRSGLDALVFELDPDWIEAVVPHLQDHRDSIYWTGPAASRRAALLAEAWLRPNADANAAVQSLRAVLEGFPPVSEPTSVPVWLDEALCGANASAVAVARQLQRNSASVARTFAAHQGESLREVRRRERVGRAARLLRETDLPLAAVAADCGFCDQAHMNRGFKAIFHRTPRELRERWAA